MFNYTLFYTVVFGCESPMAVLLDTAQSLSAGGAHPRRHRFPVSRLPVIHSVNTDVLEYKIMKSLVPKRDISIFVVL